MESISRLSSLLGSARDLTLEASLAANPTNRPSRPSKSLPPHQIKKLLDSRNERDILDGLRRVTALQYAQPPQPTLHFFPAVLKTLSNPYPSTRPLVYNYLVHHSAQDPDTALLSVNTIQKSLSDRDPRVRAMALKTMAGIKVPVISQIVSLAIKKGTTDSSPLVRKAAALACVACVRLDPATIQQVEEYLAALLGDSQYYVVGAATQAVMEICPERVDLVHGCYRRLCRMVVDMDEWGQLAVLRLLTGYARRCFPRRVKRVKRAVRTTEEERSKAFYEDLEPAADEQEREDDETVYYEDIELLHPDLELFLKNISPLLQSRNSAVVVAVARAYLYLNSTTYLPTAIGPLIALLRSPQDIRQTALHNLVHVCLAAPAQFVPYFRHFLLRSTAETPVTRALKLEVLTLVFPHASKEVQELILAELAHFSHHTHDVDLVRESVRALGRCAAGVPAGSGVGKRCLGLLLKQIRSKEGEVVGEAMEVVRFLIQRAPGEHRGTVVRLARNLDSLGSARARAGVVWVVGEFGIDGEGAEGGGEGEGGIAADVLRILVKGYADESDEVRAQIVLLAAKVYLHYLNARHARQKALEAINGDSNGREGEKSGDGNDVTSSSSPAAAQQEKERDDEEGEEEEKAHPIPLLYHHTLLLAHYTPSYDLRDRARLYARLLAVPGSTELASLVLLAPKPVPRAAGPGERRGKCVLGSLGLVVGEGFGGGLRGEGLTGDGYGYGVIPEWVQEGQEPEDGVREEDGGSGGKGEGESGMGFSSAGGRLDEVLGAGVGADSGKVAEKGKGKTLEDWLDEEETESEGSGETGSGTSEEEEEAEEESSEYEDEDDDDDEAGSDEQERAGLVRR